jgi:hypothetical protein
MNTATNSTFAIGGVLFSAADEEGFEPPSPLNNERSDLLIVSLRY